METLFFLLLMFGPLVLLLWLANLADKQRAKEPPNRLPAVLTYLLLASLWAGLFLAGLALSLVGWTVAGRPLSPEMLATYAQAGLTAEVVQRLVANLPQLGMSLWLPAIFGLILALPPVRRWLARILPIDATRATHAVALSFMMLVVVNLWFALALGLDVMADMLEADSGQGAGLQTGALLSMTWMQELLFLAMALVGVGWLTQRNLRATLERLGIVKPTGRQILIGIGLGLFLTVALLPLDYLTTVTKFGWNQDVARLSEQLIGPLTQSPIGILTLGLAAALGEEAMFRGALQPRFGLLLTSLLFALLHSNYGITLSTVVVLGIGLTLGLARRRYNTSTSMIVHATYNMSIGLASFLSLWPEW